MNTIYQFNGSNEVISPGLIYYKDIIKENIQKAITIAGDPICLWPHVKTHKMEEMVKLQMDFGIVRFKCATIAEAEMAANAGAKHVLLSYPLVGPNIKRFIALEQAFKNTVFWAIGDNLEQLKLLGKASDKAGLRTNVLIDVNMGMDRTGVAPGLLEAFYKDCSKIEGLSLRGLHCYDGHRTEYDPQKRKEECEASLESIQTIKGEFIKNSLVCDTIVIGGTPSFPCYTGMPDMFFSPGTLFVNDHGYSEKFPDLSFTPGAAILTRVVSCPKYGYFTLDLGYKGIASDPPSVRGIIVGLNPDHIEELFQSEEHWTFRMKPGYEESCPEIGMSMFVIPTHICPTSALYPSAVIVENGQIIDNWDVSARNRKITY